MPNFRLDSSTTQTIFLVHKRVELPQQVTDNETKKKYKLVVSEEKTISLYKEIIASLTTRPGTIFVLKVTNKKTTVFKQIHSDDNLRKDVRNSIAFHSKILPFLLEHPSTKFIIQHARAC
jgi:N-acetylmuramoyl-L-alanine amidase CwlA